MLFTNCVSSLLAFVFAACKVCAQQGVAIAQKIFQTGVSWRHFNFSGSKQESYRSRIILVSLLFALMLPASVFCVEREWSMGVYGGKHFDTEPANFANGNTNYVNQFIVALTASKSVWRDDTLPLSLEIDGMVGYQFGFESFYEAAIAPVLRWSSFPWKETLQTDFRFGPLGASYTTKISPLERGKDGNGSKTLNFLVVELAFSLPEKQENEVFLRLHHRCTIYDLINNYGANGEDFFALGFRQFF